MKDEIYWDDYIRKEQIRVSEEEFLNLQKKGAVSGQNQNQSQYCRNLLLNSAVTPMGQSVSRDQELQLFRTNFSRISNYMKFKVPLLNLEVIKFVNIQQKIDTL